MATAASSPSSTLSRPKYSCIRCAERKVRCDRQRPCSTCVKHSIECTFKPSQPSRKRQTRVKVQILSDRLRHYETLLQEQGIDLSKLPDGPISKPRVAVGPEESRLQTPSSTESEPNQCVNKTQVIHGQGRFNFIDK